MFRELEIARRRVSNRSKSSPRDQPCDITGIADYQMLDERGGIQWPYPGDGGDDDQQRRLFADGRFYHADGRAKFLFEEPRTMPEPPNVTYPYLLLTGRGSASQWHTQTRTAKSAVLRNSIRISCTSRSIRTMPGGNISGQISKWWSNRSAGD